MRDTGVLRMNKWKNFKAALCLGIAMSMAVVSTVSANVTGPSAGPGLETGQNPGQGAADAAEPDRLIQPFAPSGSFRNRYNIPGERDNWYGRDKSFPGNCFRFSGDSGCGIPGGGTLRCFE